MGKKDPCAVFGCNNDNLSPEKDTVKDHISNTKLGKAFSSLVLEIWCFTVSFSRERLSLVHPNKAQGSFFPLESYSKKTLRKNVPKSARKYKRNVLMPPGHPIILLKSN